MTVTTGSASDVGVRVNRAGDRDPVTSRSPESTK